MGNLGGQQHRVRVGWVGVVLVSLFDRVVLTLS